MIVFYNPDHALHAPAYEFYRGDKVPCYESPQRGDLVIKALTEAGHDLRVPNTDSLPLLNQVHSESYIRFLQTAWERWLKIDPENESVQPFPSVWPVPSLRKDIEPQNFTAQLGLYSMDNGTPMMAGTWKAAKAGADAVVTAAEQLVSGTRSVFCATRPPGHHAGADFMGGYCFLNNAALGAQTLRNNGCAKVAILDVDYHHGNGTQSIFYSRDDVLFVSIHGDPFSEYPFYLGHADEQGEEEGTGYNLNLPLSADCLSGEWFAALDKASEKIDNYQADALVVSLGLDTYDGDPISNFSLQSEDFNLLGEKIRDIGLPTLFVLEGGYATSELGHNTVKVLDGFSNN